MSCDLKWERFPQAEEAKLLQRETLRTDPRPSGTFHPAYVHLLVIGAAFWKDLS
jgi:hypothetical protein